MKTHILVINLIFLLFSCSENPPEPETDISIFLEKNKDVLFEKHNPIIKSRMPYCRFINNIMTPIEEWSDLVIWGEGCYSYIKKDYSCCYDSIEINKDSENEFQFILINNYMSGYGVLTEGKTIITYKITGTLLEISQKNYDDNVVYNSITSTWTKSSQNIDNLNICDY